MTEHHENDKHINRPEMVLGAVRMKNGTELGKDALLLSFTHQKRHYGVVNLRSCPVGVSCVKRVPLDVAQSLAFQDATEWSIPASATDGRRQFGELVRQCVQSMTTAVESDIAPAVSAESLMVGMGTTHEKKSMLDAQRIRQRTYDSGKFGRR